MAFKNDPAATWLEGHGESFRNGNELQVAKSATDLAESAPQIPPGGVPKKSGINLRKVAEVLAEYNMDPTVEIVKVLPQLDDALKAKVMLELIQYIQPKLKSIEVNATVQELTPEQAKKRLAHLMGKASSGS